MCVCVICVCVCICVHVHICVCVFLSFGLESIFCILQWNLIITFTSPLGIYSFCLIVFVILSSFIVL